MKRKISGKSFSWIFLSRVHLGVTERRRGSARQDKETGRKIDGWKEQDLEEEEEQEEVDLPCWLKIGMLV